MNALLEREIRSTDVFAFLPQHKNSLAELLNSMYGSMGRKNGWNVAVLGKKEHVLITVTHKQKISVNAAMAGKTPKDFQYNLG